MKTISMDSDSSQIEFALEDLFIINNALNEACNGISLFEFETRMGANRERATALLEEIGSLLDKMRASRS